MPVPVSINWFRKWRAVRAYRRGRKALSTALDLLEELARTSLGTAEGAGLTIGRAVRSEESVVAAVALTPSADWEHEILASSIGTLRLMVVTTAQLELLVSAFHSAGVSIRSSSPLVTVGEYQSSSRRFESSYQGANFTIVILTYSEAAICAEFSTLYALRGPNAITRIPDGDPSFLQPDRSVVVRLTVEDPLSLILLERLNAAQRRDVDVATLLAQLTAPPPRRGKADLLVHSFLLHSGLRDLVAANESWLEIPRIVREAGLGLTDASHRECEDFLYRTALNLEIRISSVQQAVDDQRFLREFGRAIRQQLGKTPELCDAAFLSVLLWAHSVRAVEDVDLLSQSIADCGWGSGAASTVLRAGLQARKWADKVT
jgi:hypothetical protein